jgi:tetratricopeptide (TPR) repeat protein
VSLQLVRTADDAAIWEETYDVPRVDLLRLQDTVAAHVVDGLALRLTSVERAQSRRPSTQSHQAYDAYLRGRARMANYTAAKMQQAIADYEDAVRLDPEYALARAALATSLAWFGVRYAYESGAERWARRAELEAQAALARDPALADAHLAIANAAGTIYRGFDWQTAIKESEKALALDPTLELAELARMRGRSTISDGFRNRGRPRPAHGCSIPRRTSRLIAWRLPWSSSKATIRRRATRQPLSSRATTRPQSGTT